MKDTTLIALHLYYLKKYLYYSNVKPKWRAREKTRINNHPSSK